MIDRLKRKIKFILEKKKEARTSHLSFSQAGEDRIIKFLFDSMGIQDIKYLEIGTNNPVDFNNTYLFYLRGNRGVCIEANPNLIPNIKSKRPNDICLNIGISTNSNEALDFYIFGGIDTEKGLSTFSKDEVERVERTSSLRVEKVIKVSTITINEVLKKYFDTKSPDFVSIDVEGIDLDILETLDFDTFRPLAICVETVDFATNHKRKKRTDIIDFMLSKNYFVYADSGINTIFVDKIRFEL